MCKSESPFASGHVVIDGGVGCGEGGVAQPQHLAVIVALPARAQLVCCLLKGDVLPVAQLRRRPFSERVHSGALPAARVRFKQCTQASAQHGTELPRQYQIWVHDKLHEAMTVQVFRGEGAK